MAKKISATINAPGHEPYRAYFHDDGETVWVWAAGTQAFGYRAGIPFDRAATEAAGETITRAVLVCIAKEAARQVVEGKPEQA